RKNEGLTMKVAGQQTTNLSIHDPFRLIADHAELRGVTDVPFQKQDELTYRITLPDRASWMEIAAASDGLILSPTFTSRETATSLLSGVPVTTLDFTKQETSGERVSALTGQGTIKFPDYPHLGSLPL